MTCLYPTFLTFKEIKYMSNVKFEVKVFNEDDDLIKAYVLSDKRYDELDEIKSMTLARNAVEWTIPESCRFTIEREKQ